MVALLAFARAQGDQQFTASCSQSFAQQHIGEPAHLSGRAMRSLPHRRAAIGHCGDRITREGLWPRHELSRKRREVWLILHTPDVQGVGTAGVRHEPCDRWHRYLQPHRRPPRYRLFKIPFPFRGIPVQERYSANAELSHHQLLLGTLSRIMPAARDAGGTRSQAVIAKAGSANSILRWSFFWGATVQTEAASTIATRGPVTECGLVSKAGRQSRGDSQ